jgi:hypothetical protein
VAPRFQPIVIDPDEVLERLDRIEVGQEDLEDPVRRELLDKVSEAAEDACSHAKLALRLVGRAPRAR